MQLARACTRSMSTTAHLNSEPESVLAAQHLQCIRCADAATACFLDFCRCKPRVIGTEAPRAFFRALFDGRRDRILQQQRATADTFSGAVVQMETPLRGVL